MPINRGVCLIPCCARRPATTNHPAALQSQSHPTHLVLPFFPGFVSHPREGWSPRRARLVSAFWSCRINPRGGCRSQTLGGGLFSAVGSYCSALTAGLGLLILSPDQAALFLFTPPLLVDLSTISDSQSFVFLFLCGRHPQHAWECAITSHSLYLQISRLIVPATVDLYLPRGSICLANRHITRRLGERKP